MGKTVTHLIIGLGKGGAETMLYQVLKYRSTPDLSYRVISLGASHFYEEPIRKLGYEVIELDIRKRPIWTFLKLCGFLRGTEILCCWMYHANFVGYIVSKIVGVKKIIWCIRHSTLDPQHNKWLTLKIVHICAHWSNHVSAISYNGMLSRLVHEEIGYCSDVGSVADNGCDCQEYKPNAFAKEELCRELGVSTDKNIVLSVTRDVPGKDIPNFIRSFSELRMHRENDIAVLCGYNMDTKNPNLLNMCLNEKLSVGKDIFFLGVRNDVPRLMAACDLYVLHSAAEAFPNALLQAMACGCLCIATDVGETRRILNRDECIVPAGDSVGLTSKMAWALSLPKDIVNQMKLENRKYVQERFDIHEIVREYEGLF